MIAPAAPPAHAPRVGIDIGGTKVEAISLSADGAIEARMLERTEPGPVGVLRLAEHVVGELATMTGRSVTDFAGVGIGIPGQVDRAAGLVRNAYNMGVTSLALGHELSERIGLPVSIDNDVTAASIGATHLMGLTGTIAYLNLGTGLAAGIVADGAPIRGVHGSAGEIGHLPIDRRGRACPCGQFGCLETVASGAALRAHWPGAGEHPGRTLLAAIEAGDSSAQDAFDALVEGAASSIRVLGLTLNPDAIVLGGGLRLIGEPLVTAIRTTLDAWSARSGFLAALELSARFRVLPENSPAAAVGAALAAPTDGEVAVAHPVRSDTLGI